MYQTPLVIAQLIIPTLIFLKPILQPFRIQYLLINNSLLRNQLPFPHRKPCRNVKTKGKLQTNSYCCCCKQNDNMTFSIGVLLPIWIKTCKKSLLIRLGRPPIHRPPQLWGQYQLFRNRLMTTKSSWKILPAAVGNPCSLRAHQVPGSKFLPLAMRGQPTLYLNPERTVVDITMKEAVRIARAQRVRRTRQPRKVEDP